MTIETSLILFKPDAYQGKLVEQICDRLYDHLSLKQLDRFQVQFTPSGIFHLWPRIYGWRWTSSLMRTFPERELDVLIVAGVGAFERVIEFKDSVRESWSQINSHKNLMHSADDEEAFRREYAYLKSIQVNAT